MTKTAATILLSAAALLGSVPAAAHDHERWNVEIRDVYGDDSSGIADGRIVGTADLVTGDRPKQVLLPGATSARPSDFTMSVRRVRGGYTLRVEQTLVTPAGPRTQTTEMGFGRPGDVELVAGFGSGAIDRAPAYMRGFVFRRL